MQKTFINSENKKFSEREAKMSSCIVGDLMKHAPLYVYENDDLFKVMEYMKKFKVDTISIINEDFSLLSYLTKKHIKDYLKANFFIFGNIMDSLKSIKVKDIMKKNTMPLTFYPTTRAEDALHLMKYFNNKCAPVVKTPWEKKVIGFLWLTDNRN